VLTASGNSQTISGYNIGTNLIYGGSESGLISEYSLVVDFGRKFSLSTRIGSNYSTKLRAGAGLLYNIFSTRKIKGLIGLEYHTNRVNAVWRNEELRFHSIHLPLIVEYHISRRVNLNMGFVFRSSKDIDFDYNFITIGIQYRLKN